MRCLDCGNKAKRECLYYRCRSCCRRHGFQCQTHVKSTWIPISTRQQLAQQNAAAAVAAPPPQYHHQQEDEQQLHLPSPSSSGFEENFPTEVRGEATFTLVRMATNLEDSIDHYAYETSINIRGHVFRGILHDQGPHDAPPMVNYSHLNEQHNSANDFVLT